jgi:hypothetical protein
VSHAGTVALLGQGVDDRDVRVDLDGLAVEGSGAVAPLADGSKRGLEKERIAGNDFQRLDRAVHGDDGVKFHAAFAADLNGERRIDGLDAVDQFALLDEAADSDEVSLRWNRRLCRRGGSRVGSSEGHPGTGTVALCVAEDFGIAGVTGKRWRSWRSGIAVDDHRWNPGGFEETGRLARWNAVMIRRVQGACRCIRDPRITQDERGNVFGLAEKGQENQSGDEKDFENDGNG